LPVVRRVTFSRNFTLSLSRTCQCYCKYCAFATHRAHIHPPEEVECRLDEALKRNTKELLVLTGERPEVNPEVAARGPQAIEVWASGRLLGGLPIRPTNGGIYRLLVPAPPDGSDPAMVKAIGVMLWAPTWRRRNSVRTAWRTRRHP